MILQDFKELLKNVEAEQIVEDIILGGTAQHVSADDLQFIRRAIAEKFSVPVEEVEVYIVGSAKLGFSISEKNKDGKVQPRYRAFSPDSDVDVAVICPKIFEMIWYELSSYAHFNTYLPWDSGKVGDYLVCGWLRLDRLPNRIRIRRWDDWRDCFRRISTDPRFKSRSVTGGIFYSKDFLKQYQLRSVKECQLLEEGDI